MTALLEVDELSIDIGGRRVVDGVSFDVAPGGRLGVIGESGSGKTLTALATMGLAPDSATITGRVRLNGRDLLGQPERALVDVRGAEMAMVFQDPRTALNPTMRIGRQISEPLRIHHGVRRRAAAMAAEEWCGRVGLPDPARIARAYPHQLSGGQRQRVGIAIALACRPALVIADEPTTALDVTVQAEIMRLLRELVEQDDTALVFISHDVALVSTVVEQVIVMRAGRIVERAAVDDVVAEPAHDYTRELLAAARLTHLEAAR